MDTTTYEMSNLGDDLNDRLSIWNDSRGGVDTADQWAITSSLSESISSKGEPFPAYSTYYRNPANVRTDPADEERAKSLKVFGNSYSAVASNTFSTQQGTATPGDGVWLDPDDIKRAYEGNLEGTNGNTVELDTRTQDWKDEILLQMDLTGPDSGIGLDKGDNTELELRNTGRTNKLDTVFGDIYYQGEYNGNIDSRLEKPLCGDDESEYLLEEMGESVNSEQYDGRYACAPRPNKCVLMSQTPRIIDDGTYVNAGEIEEDSGRPKQDEEVCSFEGPHPQALWYDQDYGDLNGDGIQDTCRTNTLYLEQGVRWINSEDVSQYPHAFTGGIDDDGNKFTEQKSTNQYTAEPNQESWSGNEVPTSSGSLGINRSIVTKGFCGGDDESEYLITQRCNSDLCETDNSIQGVARDPNSCVLDQPSTPGVSGDKRDLYQQGDTVEVDTGDRTREMACYDGEWFDKWPVVFYRDEVNVEEGNSQLLSFRVINIRDAQTTYNLELSQSSSILDDITKFEDSSADTLSVDVPATSSRNYNIEIEGSQVLSESDLELQAESADGRISGFDTATVSVDQVDEPDVPTQETQGVPGIGAIQILLLILVSSIFYVRFD